MNQLEAVRILGQQIRQLSAAAACAQVEMSTVRQQTRVGAKAAETSLDVLDRLATELAAPALKALDAIQKGEAKA